MNYSLPFQALLQKSALSVGMAGNFGTDDFGEEGILRSDHKGALIAWNPLSNPIQLLALMGSNSMRLIYRDNRAIVESKNEILLIDVPFDSEYVNALIAIQGGFSALGLTAEVRRMMAGRYAVVAATAALVADSAADDQ